MIENLGRAYIIQKPAEARVTNDFYPTPPIATLSLLKNHDVPDKIWEPAAGMGHISKELIRNGKEVISTDLFEYDNTLVDVKSGVDFLTCDRVDARGVITNPPFKGNLPIKLLDRLLNVHDYKFVAFFLRLTFMESAGRYEFFTKHPPSDIYVMSKRIQTHLDYIDKDHGLGGMIAYAWFVWDRREPYNETKMHWVDASKYIGDL